MTNLRYTISTMDILRTAIKGLFFLGWIIYVYPHKHLTMRSYMLPLITSTCTLLRIVGKESLYYSTCEYLIRTQTLYTVHCTVYNHCTILLLLRFDISQLS